MLNFRRTRQHLTRLISLISLSLLSGAGLASLASHPAFAQNSDENATSQRWYQVEVILFTQEESLDDETWRNDVALTYPSNWLELKDPNSTSESAATDPETGEAQTLERQPDINRDPFYTLPDNLRELNRQADALKYSQSHRLLFHEAWRQPVQSPSTAPSIIVAAGESYGDHRELEGSINISVSRYLHLSTNLWLTSFNRNTGQQTSSTEHKDGYWPELPTRPSQRRNRSTASQNYYQTDEDPTSSDFGLSGGNSAWETNGSTAWDSGSGGTAWERNQQFGNDYNFSSKAYLPSEISVFRQQRRMRSGEVHYIDHPKVGMVILVTPYDASADSNTGEVSSADITTNAQGLN